MESFEQIQIKSIDEKIKHLRHTIEGILPIWEQVDRRIQQLSLDIARLENERLNLANGQTELRFDVEF